MTISISSIRHCEYFCILLLIFLHLRMACIAFGSLWDQGRLDKVRTSDSVQRRLLNTVISSPSLSVLLSAMEWSITTQTGLALTW